MSGSVRLSPGFADDDVDAGETRVEAWTSIPERTLYDAIAGRNQRLVDYLDGATGAAQAVKEYILGIHNFCTRNGLRPDQVFIRESQVVATPDGAIFRSFIDRRTNLYTARRER